MARKVGTAQSVVVSPAGGAAALRAAPSGNTGRLLAGPILPTLLGMALPNVVALTILSLVVIAETSYIGILGTEALAAMALVFPFVMLTQMMSSGAMGGGIASAVSRALGSGDASRARALALHAILIGTLAGLAMSGLFLVLGAPILRLLGGSGSVLEQALVYKTVFFSGAALIWILNTLVSIVRGTGNMRLSSAMLIVSGVNQILVGGALSLGLGPLPRLGIAGVAIGQIAAAAIGVAFLAWYLTRGPSQLKLGRSATTPQPFVLDGALCRDILKVGALACLSPVQSILVVLIVARLVAGYGTAELAGFGIGMRLELLLVPIAFAFGVACVPMVGMAIGAGDVARARRVAWTGACLSGGLIGAIGVMFALWPWLWARLFTSDPAVLAAAATYLGIAGLGFPAYGVGLCLYFASQGSGKILGPVLAGTVRLVVAGLGGWWIVASGQGFPWLAAVVAVSMLAYGAATALAVKLTTWQAGGR